jgi:hypothetical protein
MDLVVAFWGGWFAASLLYRFVRWLRRPRYDDEVVVTLGPYTAGPLPGDLYPDDGWGPLLGSPQYRVTRVTGCAHRDGECRGWRAVYGVRIDM